MALVVAYSLALNRGLTSTNARLREETRTLIVKEQARREEMRASQRAAMLKLEETRADNLTALP